MASATAGCGSSSFHRWRRKGRIWYPETIKRQEDSPMTFGEKLQMLRARAGLSQDALAEAWT
jgi:hypothetical protein